MSMPKQVSSTLYNLLVHELWVLDAMAAEETDEDELADIQQNIADCREAEAYIIEQQLSFQALSTTSSE